MIDAAVPATYIAVEAWALLVAAASIVVSMLGSALGIIFQLGKRIDHQSDRIDHQSGRIDRVAEEVALVRERVARLEGSPGPGPLLLA
ncbi:MAG: hypothetical protein OXM54_08570 [Acidimicrobiaceae bacterium]|nr:hypothetical protein [Acidimicrobiaceae bacterium]